MMRFTQFMAERFDVKILHRKQRAPRVLIMLLRMMGVLRAIDWLQRWSVTGPGVVWLSFVPGEGGREQWESQVATIGHECVHVEQWRKDRARFAFNYFLSKSRRAHYEAQALHANLEIGYGFGNTLNIDAAAEQLRGYRLRSGDIATVKKHLHIYDRTARTGARGEHVTRVALAWWGV
jgi:hypothetical protein